MFFTKYIKYFFEKHYSNKIRIRLAMFFINEKENAKTKSSENWTNWTGLFSFVKFLTLFGSNLSNFGGSIGTEC